MYTPGKNSDTQAEGTQQEKFKTAKSLSGGERSFATVSLLLSLWDTSTSPLRCLDEWDVFLDHVNRNIAAKMLVGTAVPLMETGED
jgi:chromosome segregation ATPase